MTAALTAPHGPVVWRGEGGVCKWLCLPSVGTGRMWLLKLSIVGMELTEMSVLSGGRGS